MTSVTAPAPVTTASPQTASAPPASPLSGGDFEMFLKMLTTQIKNQDPLNPMEGSDFAVQLATFSGVEQQARTNQLLELMAGSQLGGLGTLAGWIGKEVRTVAPVAYEGQPLKLDIQPAATADRVELVVLDAAGREIGRESIAPVAGEITWPASGAAPPAVGRYSFKLVSHQGDQVLGAQAVGAYARVTGAEMTLEGVRLMLPGGASALESEVTALRETA